ncbi:hypothetical protein, partial [Shigella flexneri]
KNGSREYLLLSGNSSFVSINIDGRDCCQTGQFSQDVADGALTDSFGFELFRVTLGFSAHY